ncbi:MAG: hypothetical protein HC837_05865 [Chloroflexaceae bacterium]|nr:hypothetical protein [Chloroflexaceae bacterium]
MNLEPKLLTVDIFRPEYGRRYSSLPVDSLDRRGFMIDCTDTYMSPERYDLCPGDIVRWFTEDGYLQATLSSVERTETHVYVTVQGTKLLSPDFFPY